MAAAICNTPIFLPILSSQYMDKPGELWCQNELNLAKLKDKTVLPVVLKGVSIPPHIILVIGNQFERIEYDPSEPSTSLKNITTAVRKILCTRECGRCICHTY